MRQATKLVHSKYVTMSGHDSCYAGTVPESWERRIEGIRTASVVVPRVDFAACSFIWVIVLHGARDASSRASRRTCW
jgi:hypothetical protein